MKRASISPWKSSPLLASVDNVVLEGLLEKRTSGLNKSWHRKFFILRATRLEYHPSDRSTSALCDKPSGLIDLTSVATVTLDSAQAQITVSLRSGETVLLRAAAETEARNWCQALEASSGISGSSVAFGVDINAADAAQKNANVASVTCSEYGTSGSNSDGVSASATAGARLTAVPAVADSTYTETSTEVVQVQANKAVETADAEATVSPGVTTTSATPPPQPSQPAQPPVKEKETAPVVLANATPLSLREGLMLKRGQWRRKWKPRYFILTQFSLQYFTVLDTSTKSKSGGGGGASLASPRGVDAKGMKKGEVNLENRDVLVKKHPMTVAQGKYVWRFEVQVKDAGSGAQESLMCATESENERTEWIGALQALQGRIAPTGSFLAVDSEEEEDHDDEQPSADNGNDGVVGVIEAGAGAQDETKSGRGAGAFGLSTLGDDFEEEGSDSSSDIEGEEDDGIVEEEQAELEENGRGHHDASRESPSANAAAATPPSAGSESLPKARLGMRQRIIEFALGKYMKQFLIDFDASNLQFDKGDEDVAPPSETSGSPASDSTVTGTSDTAVDRPSSVAARRVSINRSASRKAKQQVVTIHNIQLRPEAIEPLLSPFPLKILAIKINRVIVHLPPLGRKIKTSPVVVEVDQVQIDLEQGVAHQLATVEGSASAGSESERSASQALPAHLSDPGGATVPAISSRSRKLEERSARASTSPVVDDTLKQPGHRTRGLTWGRAEEVIEDVRLPLEESTSTAAGGASPRLVRTRSGSMGPDGVITSGWLAKSSGAFRRLVSNIRRRSSISVSGNAKTGAQDIGNDARPHRDVPGMRWRWMVLRMPLVHSIADSGNGGGGSGTKAVLEYYKDSQQEEMLGSLPLDTLIDVQLDDDQRGDDSSGCHFHLLAQGGRRWHLCAQHDADLRRWLVALAPTLMERGMAGLQANVDSLHRNESAELQRKRRRIRARSYNAVEKAIDGATIKCSDVKIRLRPRTGKTTAAPKATDMLTISVQNLLMKQVSDRWRVEPLHRCRHCRDTTATDDDDAGIFVFKRGETVVSVCVEKASDGSVTSAPNSEVISILDAQPIALHLLFRMRAGWLHHARARSGGMAATRGKLSAVLQQQAIAEGSGDAGAKALLEASECRIGLMPKHGETEVRIGPVGGFAARDSARLALLIGNLVTWFGHAKVPALPRTMRAAVSVAATRLRIGVQVQNQPHVGFTTLVTDLNVAIAKAADSTHVGLQCALGSVCIAQETEAGGMSSGSSAKMHRDNIIALETCADPSLCEELVMPDWFDDWSRHPLEHKILPVTALAHAQDTDLNAELPDVDPAFDSTRGGSSIDEIGVRLGETDAPKEKRLSMVLRAEADMSTHSINVTTVVRAITVDVRVASLLCVLQYGVDTIACMTSIQGASKEAIMPAPKKGGAGLIQWVSMLKLAVDAHDINILIHCDDGDLSSKHDVASGPNGANSEDDAHPPPLLALTVNACSLAVNLFPETESGPSNMGIARPRERATSTSSVAPHSGSRTSSSHKPRFIRSGSIATLSRRTAAAAGGILDGLLSKIDVFQRTIEDDNPDVGSDSESRPPSFSYRPAGRHSSLIDSILMADGGEFILAEQPAVHDPSLLWETEGLLPSAVQAAVAEAAASSVRKELYVRLATNQVQLRYANASTDASPSFLTVGTTSVVAKLPLVSGRVCLVAEDGNICADTHMNVLHVQLHWQLHAASAVAAFVRAALAGSRRAVSIMKRGERIAGSCAAGELEPDVDVKPSITGVHDDNSAAWLSHVMMCTHARVSLQDVSVFYVAPSVSGASQQATSGPLGWIRAAASSRASSRSFTRASYGSNNISDDGEPVARVQHTPAMVARKMVLSWVPGDASHVRLRSQIKLEAPTTGTSDVIAFEAIARRTRGMPRIDNDTIQIYQSADSAPVLGAQLLLLAQEATLVFLGLAR